MTTKTKSKRVAGDSFILCTFSLFGRGRPEVHESGNDLATLCAKIPEILSSELDDDTLCLCSVEYWTSDERIGFESIPHGVETVFQITPYNLSALGIEDDEDDDEEEEEGLN